MPKMKSGNKANFGVFAVVADDAEIPLVERTFERLRRRGITITSMPKIANEMKDAFDNTYDGQVH
jgi:hypothetical protein